MSAIVAPTLPQAYSLIDLKTPTKIPPGMPAGTSAQKCARRGGGESGAASFHAILFRRQGQRRVPAWAFFLDRRDPAGFVSAIELVHRIAPRKALGGPFPNMEQRPWAPP